MYDKILDIDPSEAIEVVIKRHWFGLVSIIGFGGFITVILAALGLYLLSGNLEQGLSAISIGAGFLQLVALGLFLLAIMSVAVTVASVIVYKSNLLLVTNENLIQIIRTSVFNRKVSQLSLEKVQDVTSTQQGPMQSVLNYGTIFVETAGETANFGFRFANKPVIASKQINEAHERFIKKYGIDLV